MCVCYTYMHCTSCINIQTLRVRGTLWSCVYLCSYYKTILWAWLLCVLVKYLDVRIMRRHWRASNRAVTGFASQFIGRREQDELGGVGRTDPQLMGPDTSVRSLLGGLIQKDIPKKERCSLLCKTFRAPRQPTLPIFFLIPKETGWVYKEGQAGPSWTERKHGRWILKAIHCSSH